MTKNNALFWKEFLLKAFDVKGFLSEALFSHEKGKTYKEIKCLKYLKKKWNGAAVL
ncbi:MAG: hypothetical protein ACI9TY_001137 [Alphaproteobacteria bacterium]|jgi:hypothetical protein